mgnify:CR=1 FL=1
MKFRRINSWNWVVNFSQSWTMKHVLGWKIDKNEELITIWLLRGSSREKDYCRQQRAAIHHPIIRFRFTLSSLAVNFLTDFVSICYRQCPTARIEPPSLNKAAETFRLTHTHTHMNYLLPVGLCRISFSFAARVNRSLSR